MIRNYSEENATVILLGNKRDIIEENPGKLKVARLKIEEFCVKNKIVFKEISATHDSQQTIDSIIENLI